VATSGLTGIAATVGVDIIDRTGAGLSMAVPAAMSAVSYPQEGI
jgi:hypothetical protein